MEIYLELMGKIKELPALERPREKALRYGIDALSDVELLTVIIGKGYQGQSAAEISAQMLEQYQGLRGLSNSSLHELTSIKGIKGVKAISIAATFEICRRLNIKEMEENDEVVDGQYLYNKYHPKLSGEKQEVLIIVILNRKNKITYECTLYKGTENDLIFSYKDMWRELLLHNGKSFYLIHNHPFQEARPSRQDLIFNGEINRECKRIHVKMLDHLIIGDDGYYSLEKNEKFYISC